MFRAHEPAGSGPERLVAVKVFRLDVAAEQAAALVRALEQLIGRQIVHPAMAPPIAAGLDGRAVYLAMEYAVGESLDVTGRSRPMPLGEVASIIEAIADAIDRCAWHGVRHELLHPRDIIMSGDAPRVTGFGIAEALSGIGMTMPVRRPYAAPGGPSDVYSLAAIACELILGRRMTTGGWDELSAENGPALRAVFAAALSDDPRDRPARAGDFAARLREAAPSTAAPNGLSTFSGLEGRDSGLEERGREGDLDAAVLDRFADLGAAPDLQMEFAEPLDTPDPAPPPFPASWSAQPPKMFQAEEVQSSSGHALKLTVITLMVLAVCFAAGYVMKSRAAPSATTPSAAAKPPVAATTVDLPPAPAAASTLPAPSPSRPASGAAPTPVDAAPDRGRLLIRSTPADATVIINGQSRGKTPLAVRDLPLGSYTIRLARDGFAEEDHSVRLTANRPSASLIVVLQQMRGRSAGPAPSEQRETTGPAPGGQRESRGSIAVESRPTGARVFVNDRRIGSTPLDFPGLPAGPATVRIELDGYQTWATTVSVKAGERTMVTASLDRR